MNSKKKLPKKNWKLEFLNYANAIRRVLQIGELGKKAQHHPLSIRAALIESMLDWPVSKDGLWMGKFRYDPKEIIIHSKKIFDAVHEYGISRYWIGENNKLLEELEREKETRNFIRSRIKDPDLYPHLLAELSYWGWAKARGGKAILQEKTGMPDLLVEYQGESIFAEIKALSIGSSDNAVARLAKKANKQIKKGGSTAGICVIRLLEPIYTLGIGNAIPLCISKHLSRAYRITNSTDCKSVSKIVFFWDELAIRGNIPGLVSIMGFTRSASFDHVNSKMPVTISLDLEPKAAFVNHFKFGEPTLDRSNRFDIFDWPEWSLSKSDYR